MRSIPSFPLVALSSLLNLQTASCLFPGGTASCLRLGCNSLASLSLRWGKSCPCREKNKETTLWTSTMTMLTTLELQLNMVSGFLTLLWVMNHHKRIRRLPHVLKIWRFETSKRNRKQSSNSTWFVCLTTFSLTSSWSMVEKTLEKAPAVPQRMLRGHPSPFSFQKAFRPPTKVSSFQLAYSWKSLGVIAYFHFGKHLLLGIALESSICELASWYSSGNICCIPMRMVCLDEKSPHQGCFAMGRWVSSQLLGGKERLRLLFTTSLQQQTSQDP